MKQFALIAPLLLGGCSTVGCDTITMPPAEYRGAKIPPLVQYVPIDKADADCRKLGVKTNEQGRIWACTGRDAYGWWQLLPRPGDLSPRLAACLKTHEDAHLPPNPWPWYHPGGYYE